MMWPALFLKDISMLFLFPCVIYIMHKRVEKKEFINMLCMNVFVFLCVCADIWVVMDTNLEARVQPQFHSTYSMRQTLSLNLELTSSVRLAGQ